MLDAEASLTRALSIANVMRAATKTEEGMEAADTHALAGMIAELVSDALEGIASNNSPAVVEG